LSKKLIIVINLNDVTPEEIVDIDKYSFKRWYSAKIRKS